MSDPLRARRSHGAPSGRRVSRGQALVELALFFPLLVFMVIGSTDIATLLDDHLNIVYAARTGARVGSVMGRNAFADCATVGAIQAALSNNHNIALTKIIIYAADSSGNPLPNGSGGSLEEVYSGSTTCTSSSPNTGTLSNPPTVDNWPAPNRVVTPFTEQSIGVQLFYSYTFSFNPLGGGTFSATDSAVMPLEVIINQSATPTPSP